MAEETTTGGSPQGGTVDVSALTKEVTGLTEKLTGATQKLEQAQDKIKELEGQTGGLTTANKQANEKLTTYEQQVKDLTTQLEAKTGELTNWTTQHSQLNDQLGQVQAQFQQTQAELNLFKTIATTPEYHGLIGMVTGIKIANTPEEQKPILDALANGLKGQTDKMMEMFRGGGSPATPPGGAPANTGPKNIQEAATRLQQIMGSPIPALQQEAARLQEYIMQQQYGNANGGGPN
jgi:hypothetical protein